MHVLFGKNKLLVLCVLAAIYAMGCLLLLSFEMAESGLPIHRMFWIDQSDDAMNNEQRNEQRQILPLHAPFIESSTVEEPRRLQGLYKTRVDAKKFEPLWDAEPFASTLPQWAKEYFAWHRDTLNLLNANNTLWDSFQYLVVRCLHMDHKCGGLSDRLQVVPLALLLASQHQRILFIEWEKPAPLYAFLEPVAIDWRLPSWFRKVTSRTERAAICEGCPYLHFQRSPTIVSKRQLRRLATYNESILLDMRHQSHEHGSEYYDAFVASQSSTNELQWKQVFPAVWASFFQPSPPIQASIDQTMRRLGLYHGENGAAASTNYVSLQLRLLYNLDKSRQTSRIINAVHCAAQLDAPIPTSLTTVTHTTSLVTSRRRDTRQFPIIFVASDSAQAAQYASEYGSTVLGRRVVRYSGFAVNASSSTTTTATVQALARADPLHLDRGSEFVSKTTWSNAMDFDASSYFGIFVDLYILSRGRCVAYNLGGFGQLASLMSWPNDNHSSNSTCQSKRYANEVCTLPETDAAD